jgi:hypothetical protein
VTKNPFINAFAATLYISVVATIPFFGKQLFGSGPDTLLIPIAMISLFTLSAAVMGYLFLYQPLLLLLDGHKKNAVNLFLQTLVTFAGITILLFVLLHFGVFKVMK